MKRKKILFLTNHIAFFESHRLNIFKESKKRSFNFLLVSGKHSSKSMESSAKSRIRKQNINYKIIDFNSYNFEFIKEIKAIHNLYKILRKFKPDIFHTVAPKTNLYGGLVALFLNIKVVVLSFSGMGFLFTGNLSIKNFFKKKFYMIILSLILKNKNIKIIVQNKTDYNFFIKNFKYRKKIKLIKGGSGIDLNYFSKIKVRKNSRNIVFSGRLVKNKGIIEFIEAAKILKKEFPHWNFIIYGAIDYLSHDKFELQKYKNELLNETIIYKGFEQNLKKILNNTTIFCLPSYREGMPKSVLEALAAGIPCVVSNAPGCVDSIINNKTGLIFKTRDHNDLVIKLKKLIIHSKLRNIMSQNAKKFVKKDASILKVTKKIFDTYEEK